MAPTPPPQSTATATAATAVSRAATKPAPATRSVTVPAPEDLELAKEDALLQLRIGRSAHLYAVLISAALAFDGIILLLFDSNLPALPAAVNGLAALNDSSFLLIPLAAGLAISIIGVTTKWEAFQLWPWEAHFSTTVGALGLNVFLAIVYGTRIAGVGPFAHLAIVPWLYPATLAGISVAMIGLVLTWTSWGLRQWASALSAGLPVATAALIWVNTAASSTGVGGLAVSLFLSAILFQTSGSFLHLISSGTRPHERELITSGQSRMFRMADEVRQRDEALHAKHALLSKKETDLENLDASLRRQKDSLAEARQQLDDLETDYRTRSDTLATKERESAGRLAEFDARSQLLDDRNQALELREQEVQRVLPQISAREQRLVDRESEQTRRDVELTQRKLDLDRRVAALPETEGRLDARRRELDQKNAELLRREGELSNLESAAASGSLSPTPAATDLSQREVKLQQFKAVLDEQNLTLGRKARENADRQRAVEESLRQAADREAAVAAREASLRQREADLPTQAQSASEARSRYDTAAKAYEARLTEVAARQADLATRTLDLDRSRRELTDREALLGERERRFTAERDELDRRAAELAGRERQLHLASSDDLSDASATTIAAAVGPLAATPGGVGSDALGGSVKTPQPGRVSTGIPRLDDLLLGGLPPRSHVVLLGDAFVGKEIVLYSFLAEGVKRGEPAVIVTATRSPDEVSASLSVVLPEFRDYERRGLVTWIDASGGKGPSSAQRIVVGGPEDRAGILSNLVRTSKSFADAGRGSIRVGFLGLSPVLAHGDERAGLSFVQNVVGILKPREALAMYSLEGGAVADAQVESILGRMDGAIAFRQDRDKTFLAVRGLGEVQTHDWVECRATNRALIIGSFALERIR